MNITDGQSRTLRGLLQLLAGGALDALMRQLGADLEGIWLAPYVPLVYAALVNYAQNALEQAKVIPAILKPAPPSEASVSPAVSPGG